MGFFVVVVVLLFFFLPDDAFHLCPLRELLEAADERRPC